jgi:hypothetical protein
VITAVLSVNRTVVYPLSLVGRAPEYRPDLSRRSTTWSSQSTARDIEAKWAMAGQQSHVDSIPPQ